MTIAEYALNRALNCRKLVLLAWNDSFDSGKRLLCTVYHARRVVRDILGCCT